MASDPDYQKRYYQEHKEHMKAKAKAYALAHPEKMREYQARSRGRKDREKARAYNREYKRARPAQVAAEKRRVLIRSRGMMPSEYPEILAAQGGKCAICGRPDNWSRRMTIDHDHVTGEHRALLCGPCNSGLGSFHDDVALLAAAIEYIHFWKQATCTGPCSELRARTLETKREAP